MDKTTIAGFLLGIIAVSVGMVMKGVQLQALFNPAAILIILAGTAASVVIAFPTSEIRKVPGLFRIIFTERKSMGPAELVTRFTELAGIARRDGILALNKEISKIDDPFMKHSLSLAIDGKNADYIRDILHDEISAMEERHDTGAAIFSQAGTYAPTLGVLGAVVGLIAALGNMNDTDELGIAISAAFMATLFGIFTGYVWWHPFANKLKRKSMDEVRIMEMIVEGTIAICEGEVPRAVEQRLASHLSNSERRGMTLEGNEA